MAIIFPSFADSLLSSLDFPKVSAVEHIDCL